MAAMHTDSHRLPGEVQPLQMPLHTFRPFSRPPGCMNGTLCHERNAAVCECLSMQAEALGLFHERVKSYVRFMAAVAWICWQLQRLLGAKMSFMSLNIDS